MNNTESAMNKETILVENLQSFIDGKVKADEFSGSILIVQNNSIILQRSEGFANTERQTPNTFETKFNLGSANKMFTGVAIAQLAQKGLLKFQDNVGMFLPDYPNQTVKDQTTIDQLLTHTSGLGSFIDLQFRDEFLAVRSNLKSIQNVVDLFKERRLPYKPGEVHYSSDGYELLGLIIEKISGKNYYEYIQENIYKVASMPNTDSYEINPLDCPLDIAIGYTSRDPHTDTMKVNSRSNNFDLNLLKGTAGGAGYSTIGDLNNFLSALSANKLLGEEMTRTILTPYVKEGSKDGQTKYYGYGFQVWDINGVRMIGHPGRFAGVNVRVDAYPDLGYRVIVLANYDPPSAYDIAEEAKRLIV